MNIDEKIKQELESESQKLEELLPQDPGLFTMLLNAYKGSLGGWLILMSLVSLILGIAMMWSAYQFFIVQDLFEHKMYWGIVLLLTGMMVSAIKMWFFMEMNRQTTNREIKRLELAIEKLTAKFPG